MVLLVQGRAKKILLSSVTHVLSGLLGCALAALNWWVVGRREIQTCRNFFAPPCKYASPIHVPALLHLKDLEFQSSFAEFLSKSDSPEKVQGSETRGVRISHLTTKASKLWHPPAASQIYLNFQSSNL